MECHYHPGVPGVASCGVCHVFICRPCLGLNDRPGETRCSDCLIGGVQGEIKKIVGRLTAAVVVAAIALVVFEVLFGMFVSSLATDILGVLLAYVAGSMVLAFPLGPLYAPWLVADMLAKLEQRREEEASILAVRDGAPPPRLVSLPDDLPPDGEPQPVGVSGGPTPTPQPPTPRLGPRRRFGPRRSHRRS